MHDFKIAERRQWSRRSSSIRASFWVISGYDGSTSDAHQGLVTDMAQGGIRMQVKTIRAEGLHVSGQMSISGWSTNSLRIELEIPIRPPQKIEIAGTAEWIEKLPMSQEYIVGVSINLSRMKDQEKRLLRNYMATRR